MEFKQVDYVNNKNFVLTHGTHKGYEYYILNGIICPIAYINLPRNSYFFENEEAIKEIIKPHGGISRISRGISVGSSYAYGYWIGWDYGCDGDYTTLIKELNARKWTTEEIYNDVINTIEKVKEYDK